MRYKWQFWNSNMLFHWDRKNGRGFKRRKRSFLEQWSCCWWAKTKLLCTEGKNPCPLVTVLSSVWIHFGERSRLLKSKGLPRPRWAPNCASPGLGLLLGPEVPLPTLPFGDSQPWLPVSFPQETSFALPTLVRVCNQRTMKLGLLKRDRSGRMKKSQVWQSFLSFV